MISSARSTATGYLWDPVCLGHKNNTVHPEKPERLKAIDPSLINQDLPGLRQLHTDPHIGLPWVRRVHDAGYIDLVRGAHRVGKRVLDHGETLVNEDTFEVAIQAAAGAVTAVDAVCSGKVKSAFAAIRPPGHHAGTGHARCFCVFNNVAVAATYAREQLGLERVLIVDWDVHPADGTAAIFYEDPFVHVVSIHEGGLFPETVGTRAERGVGAGEGFTTNLPMPARSTAPDYFRELEPVLERIAQDFRPELVLISCGFDAHSADMVSSVHLDDNAFERLTSMIQTVADQTAEGRVVSLLEGGYCVPVLRRCVRAHLRALMD